MRMRGNSHKLQKDKLKLGIQKKIICMVSGTVVQRGCEISILGYAQNTTRQELKQLDLTMKLALL